MTACLVEITGVPADDPALLALLANPPVTPPAPTQTHAAAPLPPPSGGEPATVLTSWRPVATLTAAPGGPTLSRRP